MGSELVSDIDYVKTTNVVRTLKADLFALASQKGNLDPEVIALSQEIDRYIVWIQKHWQDV